MKTTDLTPFADFKSLSRRRLLSSAASAASLAVVAPLLGRPATSLAQTPVASMASISRTPAATPSPDAPPMTLDAVLQSGLSSGLPGVALRVERGTELVFEQAVGLASLEDQTPLTPADRFRIASITKTFTAVLVLQLVDEAVLTLDDTVSRWLDDPVVNRIPYVDRITLRQLLSHTSGVYNYLDDDSPFWQDAYFGEGVDWSRVWTPLELLAYADGAKHAPSFVPGEGTHYSNTAYILLGLILEQAAGQPYAEQLRSRILAPLDLADTFYAAMEAVPDGTADGYHLIDGELVNVSSIHLSTLGTAGGMVSTTRDLACFASALFGGELFEPATKEEMLSFVSSEWPGLDWGLGVGRQRTSGTEIVGMGGDGPGSAARMYRVSETNATFVLLTNTGGDDETADLLIDQAIQVTLGIDPQSA